MADRLVWYAVDEKVSLVTLNRPATLNAISAELQRQLTEAFARADADPATSVVLLRAEGRSFCAGYDIGAQPEGTDDWRSNPTKAHAHLGTAARIRDGAVANEETGGRRSAGPCAGRRVRVGHAVRHDDRRRQRHLRRAGGTLFGNRAGDRYADDHRLQKGPRAAPSPSPNCAR